MRRPIVVVTLSIGCLALCAASGTSAQPPSPSVEQYGLFGAAFEDPDPVDPPINTPFTATFRRAGKEMTVPGFWDGGSTYRVRFCPPDPGPWSFETASDRPALDGKTGTFTAVTPTGGNHGPIQVFKTHYLRYADGTPYHQFGTTCYAWMHQPPETQEQTLETLATSPFNKIRFCVFPKHYTYNKNEPDFFAFEKKADGSFDFGRPDVDFWRHFEARILDLQRLGIEADVILWHPYDRWGFAGMSDEEDDRYLRYCIARLAAYRNVWWSLANEYDFMTSQPADRPGNKDMADWDRFFSILDREDPYRRMRGIHNGRTWYDHTRDWVVHASLQTSDMKGGIRYRDQFQKPILYDECKYEGNVPQGWGNLSGREMTQRFWLGTMSGCYVGHGETYIHPTDQLWWAKGGILHGESPPRIQWLRDRMEEAPPFDELVPMGDDQGHFMLGKEGAYYLVYCLAGQSREVSLPDDRPYKVDVLDPWRMTEEPIGTLNGGVFTASAGKEDRVYRFTPYAPGEAVRPEARPTASVTEGLAPLEVVFESHSPHNVVWDFDGKRQSEEPNPTHTFRKPGFYTVTMTVTDDQGNRARGEIPILVDNNPRTAIVQIGVTRRDSPGLKAHGTATRVRHMGIWIFPDGEPWGRAEVANPDWDGLYGLRSFTIMGWVKPDSMETGSGGNRILYCLQESSAGIDLVHLKDGRMRLAINEWPDRVNNDSAAGRLKTGHWTFFAVTYDGTATENNVAWYFTEPSEFMRAGAELRLDRITSYARGAVAAPTGPLAIGNFNSTMKNYGWDRQFRGEIKGLRVFGSRISEEAAFDLEEIRSRNRRIKPDPDSADDQE